MNGNRTWQIILRCDLQPSTEICAILDPFAKTCERVRLEEGRQLSNFGPDCWEAGRSSKDHVPNSSFICFPTFHFLSGLRPHSRFLCGLLCLLCPNGMAAPEDLSSSRGSQTSRFYVWVVHPPGMRSLEALLSATSNTRSSCLHIGYLSLTFKSFRIWGNAGASARKGGPGSEFSRTRSVWKAPARAMAGVRSGI